jgi:hypothetical protein
MRGRRPGWRRPGRRGRGGRRWIRRLRCLAHNSHNASGRHPLRLQSGRQMAVSFSSRCRATKFGSPAPHWDAGLMARLTELGYILEFLKSVQQEPISAIPTCCGSRSRGLRSRRRQRWSYRRWHLPGLRVGEFTAESGSLSVVVGALAHGVLLGPVVVASVVTQVGDAEAGEENRRDDEQDPGHDHDPRCEPVEPVGLHRCSRCRSGDRGRRGWGFRCFTHT